MRPEEAPRGAFILSSKTTDLALDFPERSRLSSRTAQVVSGALGLELYSLGDAARCRVDDEPNRRRVTADRLASKKGEPSK
jgi:hypothetical protein